MPATQTTRLGRKWLIKMTVFLVACLGTGAYFGYDAAVGYPRRGARAAERLEFQYLDALTRSGTRTAIVSFDPGEEHSRLRSARPSLSPDDRAKYDWLEQLRIVGALDKDHTNMPDAAARYRDLKPRWLSSAGKVQPAAPLNAYDIPIQWLIAVGGLGAGVWLLVHAARVWSRRFSWDPEEKRLYLPDGSSLVPSDVAEFDKRKWDKFLIYLRIHPHHQRHGGKELMFDLYHHEPLEEWVLEMERIAFPESAKAPSHGGTPPRDEAAAAPA